MNGIAENTRGVRADALVGALGVDLGSLYVKLVWVRPDGSRYVGSREHQGRPVGALRAILEAGDVPEALPIGVTGPLADVIVGQGVGIAIDPIRASIRGVREAMPEVRNVLDVGGGSLSRLTIDEDGQLVDYSTNSLCAAGTGSFLDEQARRMGLEIADIERFRGVDEPPKVATRCAVFAKSDLIHRQQEGYGPEAMWSGLCRGLVGTILQTLCNGRNLHGPTLMIGGVSRNPEVLRWMRQRLGDEFRTHDEAYLLPAIGAARIAAADLTEASTWTALAERKPEADDGHRRPALELRRTTYPSMEVLDEYRDERGTEIRRHVALPTGPVEVAMGVDIGSTSTKAVLMTRAGDVLLDLYCRTSGDPIGAVKRLLEAMFDLQRRHACAFEVIACATTGSGRKMVGQVIGADLVVNEISAHVRGAQQVDPDVETIFEIGGQDAKFMDVRGGFLRDVNMNYVCAAGTGSFVEEQALKLGFPIETVGDVTMGIAPPVTSDRCTVFMEQDVHRLLRQGFEREEVMAAVLYSVVQNYLGRVVGNRKRSRTRISFQGATARNQGLVAAFENLLGVEVVVSPLCHQMGAYGSALLAVHELAREGRTTSGFRGLDLARREIALTRETCELCNNLCTITTAHIEGEDAAPTWGYLCGRDPEEQKMRRPEGFEPLSGRMKAWSRSRGPRPPAGAPLVGLPRALGMWDLAPLWRTLMEGLGCRVKLSPRTDAEISSSGIKLSGADYCYPMKLVHGHAAALLEDDKVDFVLLPFVIGEEYDPEVTTQAHLCPLNIAMAASVRAACSGAGIDSRRLLSPDVYLSWPERRIVRHLHDTLGPALGVSRRQVRDAWRGARQALTDFRAECREIGEQALDRLHREGGEAIVLLGRAYNLHDEGANVALPRKLAELGWTVLSQDLLPTTDDTLGEGHRNMFWWSGRRILEAARYTRDDPRLHAVCFTNFACGPDSFVLTYIEELMGEQPYLTLELDEHGSDGGYLTRIEAFLDVLGQGREPVPAPAPARKPAVSLDRVKGRTLWLPPMHDYGPTLLGAAFRHAGFDARGLPPETERAFERGKQFCRGGECLPAPATLGALLHKLDELGADPTEHSIFMPTAAGPCRFGQYNHLNRIALDRVGMDEMLIVSPGSDDTYGGVGTHLQLWLWKAVVLSDVVMKLRCRTRPYEVDPGRVDDIVDEGVAELAAALESGREPEPIVRRLGRRLARVPMRDEVRPLVGVVGEIYVRCNKFCNQDVIGTIERAGGEAWLAPISEWILYTSWCETRVAGENVEPLHWARAKLKHRLLLADEHRYHDAAGPLLADRREPPVAEAVAAGERFVPVSFEGETILTIGRAIRFLEQGARMVVNCAPFTCMPGALTTGVLRQVQEELGAPVVSLFYDGTGDVNRRVTLTLRNLGDGGGAPLREPAGEAAAPAPEPSDGRRASVD